MGRRLERPRRGTLGLAISLASCLAFCLSTAPREARASQRDPAARATIAVDAAASIESTSGATAGGTPLAPPTPRTRTSHTPNLLTRSMVWNGARVTALLALLGVVLFLKRMWLSRRAEGIGEGVVHVFGKVALDARQQLHFVRVGRRLLVLLQGPQGLQHVTEIDDPEEVERVLAHWSPAETGRTPRRSSGKPSETPAETTLADDYRSFTEGVREGAFGLPLQEGRGRSSVPEARFPPASGSLPRSNSYFA